MDEKYFTNDFHVSSDQYSPFDMSEIKPLNVYPTAMNSGAAVYPATVVGGPINNFGAAVVQGNMGQDFYPATVSGTASAYSSSNINSCASVSLETISESFNKGDEHNLEGLSGSTFLARPTKEQNQSQEKTCTNSRSNFYKLEFRFDIREKPSYGRADQIAKIELHRFLRYSHVQFLAGYYYEA